MYIPRPFTVDTDIAHDLLRQVTVGQLVTATQTGPVATLMPWVPDLDSGSLVGHMARPNHQWQTPWLGQALVIVEGPNGYVSPSWYASKAEHGRVVPTWDYIVVQVYGDLVVHDDPVWTEDAVRRLTDRHEQHRADPWSMDDAPVGYINGQMQGIVGIELRIDRIHAAMKMSQNMNEADKSKRTVGKMLGTIRSVFQLAMRKRVIRLNPAADVTPLGRPPKDSDSSQLRSPGSTPAVSELNALAYTSNGENSRALCSSTASSAELTGFRFPR